LEATDKLQSALQERYGGSNWELEAIAGEGSPLSGWTAESLALLDELKGDIQDLINETQKEFKRASTKEDTINGQT
jgi:hypothetical protein